MREENIDFVINVTLSKKENIESKLASYIFGTVLLERDLSN